MQKGLSWYAILLKENLKKRTTWLAAAAMLFLLYIVSGIHLPETDNVSVGLCAGQNVQDYEFLTELQSESGRFRYVEYADEERLYQDVQSGKLECAFLLDERFEQKVEAGSLKDCVYYISNPHTTKGEVAKEAFFAAFFRSYSKKLLEKSEREIFTEHSSSRLKAMEMENEKFLQSDFFRMDVVEVEQETPPEMKTGNCCPIQGIFGLFLLGFMYFANARQYEPKGKWVKCYFSGREGFLFSTLGTYAAATMPALVGIIFMLTIPVSRGWTVELLRLVLLVLTGAPWIVIYTKLSRSMEAFAANGLILFLAGALLYPIFWDIASWIPIVRYLRYLTPLGLWI